MAANASSSGPAQSIQKFNPDMDSVHKHIAGLTCSESRETSLLELCKIRENVPELAPLLWNACGAIAALLQEICAIYPYINPPSLNAHQSNRVCNALALLQCLASHPDTRSDFLKANIPLYLYTFLNTNNRNRPFEYLRLTSLGVIGALVKTDEPEVITFLLGSEIIPLCLVIMESGSELSKTVATFIMQKLLLDDVGLAYICQTYERFVHVATVLDKMVSYLAKEQKLRLLKHVIRCYLRLSDDSRARDALRSCLPHQLTDNTFTALLEEDMATKRWLNQLLRQVSARGGGGGATLIPTTAGTGGSTTNNATKSAAPSTTSTSGNTAVSNATNSTSSANSTTATTTSAAVSNANNVTTVSSTNTTTASSATPTTTNTSTTGSNS